MKKLFIGLIGAITSLAIFTAPMTAQAQLFQGSIDEACSGAKAEEGGTCDGTGVDRVNTTLKTGLDIFSVVVGIITVVMFVLSGLRFVTSQGDPGNISKARSSLVYAMVGLVVVALSQAAVRFVFSKASSPPPHVCADANGDGSCDDGSGPACTDTNGDGDCGARLNRPIQPIANLYTIKVATR